MSLGTLVLGEIPLEIRAITLSAGLVWFHGESLDNYTVNLGDQADVTILAPDGSLILRKRGVTFAEPVSTRHGILSCPLAVQMEIDP